ncbi:MAG: transporter associated domain-containing protein [Christensenellales bacterium]
MVQIDAHTCIVDGDANLYDLFDIFDYEPQDSDSEYNTVGGWATEAGRIASPRWR